jgi:hypothetical protein
VEDGDQCTLQFEDGSSVTVKVADPAGSFQIGELLQHDIVVDAGDIGEKAEDDRSGPGYLNRISASIGGASAGVKLPSGRAAA